MAISEEEHPPSSLPTGREKTTGRRYLLVHLCSFPFWGLLYLLPMILYKDLGASPFQVATIIALKPLVSLFSPYWSQFVHGHTHRLIPNLYWANLLKFFPFLFVLFINNSWYYIASFGLFMMLSRGTIPSWIEVLRINVSKNRQERICATGSTIDFLGTALLPFAFGGILDNFYQSWRLLFLLTAALGMLSTLFIIKLPKPLYNHKDQGEKNSKHLGLHFLAPWKNFIEILSKRQDFLRFQIGFFLGGSGLMIIHPILPKYFVDTLHLSYSGMLTAIAAFKGIGFTLSSPLWIKIFRKTKIFVLCAFVTGFAALFPLLIAIAHIDHLFVYLAYLIYGIMQGGSELSWKMSGMVFSKSSDSSPYSSINVLAVGIRGLIIPYVGSLLFSLSGSYLPMLILGSLFSISATVVMAFHAKKEPLIQ